MISLFAIKLKISHNLIMENRTLYFGDNLEILREKIPDETFDLIYLDPPFNSNRNYNVIFKEELQDSPAQVQAFEDSWHWTREAQATFDELVGVRQSKTKINDQISNLMLALRRLIGDNDVLAYLTMMTVRLIELRRVLKSTGSIYLHCDPTASHYLKLVMDAIFGKQNFRNEIVWHYRTWQGQVENYFPKKHDIILFYTKSDEWQFKLLKDEATVEDTIDFHRWNRYLNERNEITGANYPKTDSRFDGYIKRWIKEHGKEPEKDDVILKIVGLTVDTVWDIKAVDPKSSERLGYVTQKPEALLERIIKASSNEGDWVLDPFCGCGTTVSVAERLNRKWIGIDITMLAINLIRRRLSKQFPDIPIYVDGRPKDIPAARALFKKDPFEFEYWALDMVSAVPSQSKTEENMRGADKGIDGVINFVKNINNGKYQYGKLLIQVKGGAVHRDDIATLKGDVERERAEGGILITLEPPTQPMKQEAVSAGSYGVSFSATKFSKIQILTIDDLLNNKKPEVPFGALPHHKEAKASQREKKTPGLFKE